MLLEEIGIAILQALKRHNDGTVIDNSRAAVDHHLLVEAGVPGKADVRGDVSEFGHVEPGSAGTIALPAKKIGNKRNGGWTGLAELALHYASTHVLIECIRLNSLKSARLIGH